MSVNWWCYVGWPKPIQDIYTKALKDLDGDEAPLHWGPAHIVWEDENWHTAQWCLDNFEEYADRERFSKEALEVVRRSLVELLAVDAEYRKI